MRDTGLGVKCQCYGLGLGYKVRIKDTYRIRNAWVRKGWGYEMSESDDSRNVLCFTAAIQTVISETVQSRTVRSIGGVARKTNFTHSSLIFTGGGWKSAKFGIKSRLHSKRSNVFDLYSKNT